MTVESLALTFSLPVATFVMIFLAEFGDKSQLVCMTLAARHPHQPVFWGATLAFVLLNLLAVVFGSVVASWVPDYLLSALVAILFLLFGLQAILTEEEDDEEDQPAPLANHKIFLSAFLMLFVAEFGDKTQLAVAGLGSQYDPIKVWLGSTLALTATTALGVFAGRHFLTRFPMVWIHRISGAIFILMGMVAGSHFVSQFF